MGHMQFLVKWKDFDNESDNTWEPFANLKTNVVLHAYVRTKKLKIRGLSH